MNLYLHPPPHCLREEMRAYGGHLHASASPAVHACGCYASQHLCSCRAYPPAAKHTLAPCQQELIERHHRTQMSSAAPSRRVPATGLGEKWMRLYHQWTGPYAYNRSPTHPGVATAQVKPNSNVHMVSVAWVHANTLWSLYRGWSCQGWAQQANHTTPIAAARTDGPIAIVGS